METVFGMMDMLPPVTQPSYPTNNSTTATASKKAALDDMLAASAYLHILHGGAEATEVIDVAMTCAITMTTGAVSVLYFE